MSRSRVQRGTSPALQREPYDWPEPEALDRLAARLNRHEKERRAASDADALWPPDDETQAWGDAEAVISALVEAETEKPGMRRFELEEARREFLGYAHDAHVVLDVRADAKTGAFRVGVTPIGARARVLAVVWQHVFPGEAWKQLGRCRRCARWFVDHSDSQSRNYCSESCRMRWWGRGRRRKAGHKSQRPLTRAARKVGKALKRAGMERRRRRR